MDDQALRKLLEQLQGELKNVENIDSQGREQLRRLEAEIHQFLGRSEGEKVQPSMMLGLEDTITQFEVTHPTLTQILSEIMTTLSNAGV
jgi:hypothetical protein